MAEKSWKRIVMGSGTAAVLMGVLLHAGQAAPAPKNEDVLPALLAEVKGLRAAMEQMASAGRGSSCSCRACSCRRPA